VSRYPRLKTATRLADHTTSTRRHMRRYRTERGGCASVHPTSHPGEVAEWLKAPAC
jgi:hypothetical protein